MLGLLLRVPGNTIRSATPIQWNCLAMQLQTPKAIWQHVNSLYIPMPHLLRLQDSTRCRCHAPADTLLIKGSTSRDCDWLADVARRVCTFYLQKVAQKAMICNASSSLEACRCPGHCPNECLCECSSRAPTQALTLAPVNIPTILEHTLTYLICYCTAFYAV